MTAMIPDGQGAPSWLENTWYVGCASDEVGPALLSRTICGEMIVFYREEGGIVSALEDYCPHRGAPLSLGSVRGGQLVCGYHGLAINCTGRTAAMPGQRVGGFPPIRAYPVVERHGFVWIWPGDRDMADPTLLPIVPWAQDGWVFGGGRFHVRCDYRLMIDNLMDLTHETYVHGSSIGQKEIDEAPVRTTATTGGVVTRRQMQRVSAPPFWRMAMRGAGLPEEHLVDRWQNCHFSLPSTVMIEVGVALEGHGGPDAEDAVKATGVVVDFMTPETATSHWYYWGMARRFASHDVALTDTIREGQKRIFAEDLEMLERQQLNIDRHPGRALLKLNIDAGGARSRLMIDRAIALQSDQQKAL